jgi:glycosyltransferase involved in cell wall biosynthesis
MAAGIPVVASDYEQVREIVLGSRAGLTADPRDPAAISRALRAILGDAAEARAMGERGRAAIERRYNWSESARALTDVYREVAERARLTAAR